MALSESERWQWYWEVRRRFNVAYMPCDYKVEGEWVDEKSMVVRIFILQCNDSTFNKIYEACEKVRKQLERECPLRVSVAHC